MGKTASDVAKPSAWPHRAADKTCARDKGSDALVPPVSNSHPRRDRSTMIRMDAVPRWKAYEHHIAGLLACEFPDAEVMHDVRLEGKLSGCPRQVDVLVRSRLGRMPHARDTVVECRAYGRRLIVGDVERFVGFLQDVGVERGVLVTPVGFSAAAEQRAAASGVELWV